MSSIVIQLQSYMISSHDGYCMYLKLFLFFLFCFLTAVEIVSKIIVVAIDLERDYLFKKVQYKLKLFKNNGKK